MSSVSFPPATAHSQTATHRGPFPAEPHLTLSPKVTGPQAAGVLAARKQQEREPRLVIGQREW